MEMAEKKLREGKIKPIDIPYMQRPGGKPDNSDLTKDGYWKDKPNPGKPTIKFPWSK
jgi:hypothetical protein